MSIARTDVNTITCDGCGESEAFGLYEKIPEAWKPIRVQLGDNRSRWFDFCPACKPQAQAKAEALTKEVNRIVGKIRFT